MSEIKKNEPWAGHTPAEVERFIKKQLQVLNGDFVDLGLPSGRLWASCNLGANAPEEAGLYFMWGDIHGHAASEGFNFEWGGGYDSSTHKFDPNGNYGKCAGAEIFTDIPVDEKYDAARYMLGECARIPTRGDCYELNEFCTKTWKQVNGVNGYEFVGPNGNKIFLPAAGYFNGDKISGVGSYGYYWESALYVIEGGCRLLFGSGGVSPDGDNYRCYGCSVRPVQ